MSNKKPYYGAARFVEIAPPGIPHRATVNVDHITSVTFGEKREDVSVLDPDAELDSNGDPALPGGARMMPQTESVLKGFTVTLGVGGSNSEFTFIELSIAMFFYNDVLKRIHSLCPASLFPPMQAPAEPEEPPAGLVGANGEALEVTPHDDYDPDLDEDGDDMPGLDDLDEDAPYSHIDIEHIDTTEH
jgi:hypothetical protein